MVSESLRNGCSSDILHYVMREDSTRLPRLPGAALLQAELIM